MDSSLEKAPLLIERFTQYLGARGKRPATVLLYVRAAREFIQYLESEEQITDLCDVDKSLVSRYQAYLFQGPRRLRLKTQQTSLIGLKNFFNFLEASDLILSNPTTQMELPKLPKALPMDCLSEREMKKLLASVDLDRRGGLRDKAILEVFYSTAIRSGELVRLKLFDFDQSSGTLTIREGKGGKDRVVPIGEVASHYLRLYLMHERPALVIDETDSTLFLRRRRRRGKGPMTASNMGSIVQKYAHRADITKRVYPHMIRRSCATHMLRRGAPIRYLQELLGHNSLDTTQKYTQVVIRDLKKIHRKTHPRELE